MYRIIAFATFWIAVGMLLMIFIGNNFVGAVLVIVLLLVSYNMFFCRKW